ncbi:LysM domain-containing protein [Maribacter sp. ACAM166]|uniref:LysM domain-containing protein n=1 Tax=Maribacter sp. ACAM166 TaxID=2508996 RepID=UPI0010FD144E|nr:LysM domain-containing protein [Maribacter sp. ACAM166]TLP81349.1 LysM domain-containing protein [Maribacter sp. ACAM166]
MNSTPIIQGQTLFDIAIQEYGTPLPVLLIALENGLAVTDELEPGQTILLPDYDGKKVDIAGYYSKKSIWPSTALTDAIDDLFINDDPCDYCKCFT